MIHQIQDSLWRQFGASINMLHNVIASCPEHYFTTNKRFYYLAYHSVIFLDYYLTIPPKDFSPTLTFTSREADQRPPESIGDMIPDKIYSKQELMDYTNASNLKCKSLIESLTDTHQLNIRFTEGNEQGDIDVPILEILLYNLRHTQHHVGQLHLIIRQDFNKHVEWSFSVED